MTIASVELYRYTLPLTAPLSVGSHPLTERRGLLLRLEGPAGCVGWGEAAPLPGFSSESLEEAVEYARRLAEALCGEAGTGSDGEELLRQLPLEGAPPSVQFAVESATLELAACSGGRSVFSIVGGERDSIALNALLREPLAAPEEEAERIRRGGYQAVKVKVGRDDVVRDAARVRHLHRALGEGISLRLDANRAWTLPEAIAFARALGDVPLAYLEEPLTDPALLSTFVEETGLPVALDESTREAGPEILRNDLPIRAVVLKPTLLGLTRTRRWAREARLGGILPVISAAYESGVGLRMLVVLAASLSEAPAGISTYSRLAEDVLVPPLSLDTSVVDGETLYDSTVDRSRLDPIEVSN